MASYRDKINQKQMSTESGKIAWAIHYIESCGKWRFKKDWMTALREDEGIPLFDDICLYQGKGDFIYVIVKPVDYKPNRYWCKYVQQYMTYDWMVKMLDAQPWAYI